MYILFLTILPILQLLFLQWRICLLRRSVVCYCKKYILLKITIIVKPNYNFRFGISIFILIFTNIFVQFHRIFGSVILPTKSNGSRCNGVRKRDISCWTVGDLQHSCLLHSFIRHPIPSPQVDPLQSKLIHCLTNHLPQRLFSP